MVNCICPILRYAQLSLTGKKAKPCPNINNMTWVSKTHILASFTLGEDWKEI